MKTNEILHILLQLSWLKLCPWSMYEVNSWERPKQFTKAIYIELLASYFCNSNILTSLMLDEERVNPFVLSQPTMKYRGNPVIRDAILNHN